MGCERHAKKNDAGKFTVTDVTLRLETQFSGERHRTRLIFFESCLAQICAINAGSGTSRRALSNTTLAYVGRMHSLYPAKYAIDQDADSIDRDGAGARLDLRRDRYDGHALGLF